MKTETPKTQSPVRGWLAAPAALASALWLTGCVVTSVYPFYQLKDVIFDAALLGVWGDATKADPGKETWTFEKLDDRTYKLITADGDPKTEFDARLFKLGNQLFLDCLPRERQENSAPLHFLMRVDALSPRLEMRLLDYDWLGQLVEKDPRAIRHIIIPKKAGESGDGGELVLTAGTSELQKFLRKHLETAAAWGDPVVMKKP